MHDLLEYDIFIPTMSAAGLAHKKDVIDLFKRELVKEFGGLTVTSRSNEGLWKIARQVVCDEIQIWRVLSKNDKAGDEFMRALRPRIQEALREDMILIIRRGVEQI